MGIEHYIMAKDCFKFLFNLSLENNYVMRNATERDEDIILDLWKEAFLEYPQDFWDRWKQRSGGNEVTFKGIMHGTRSWKGEKIIDFDGIFLVFYNEKPVAFFIADFWEIGLGGLRWAGVTKEHRGKGLYRPMQFAGIRFLIEYKAKIIMAHNVDPRLIHLYEKEGFKSISTEAWQKLKKRLL
jgi:GNAT superfamily N-acetyltransferase